MRRLALVFFASVLVVAVGACVVPQQPPAAGGSFPNAATTGPTGTLTAWTGSLDFRTPGQVISNKLFTLPGRGIYIAADNVTFRNCKFVMTGALNDDWTMMNPNNHQGTVVTDSEFDGRDLVPRGISGEAVTVVRTEIHNVGNAIETESSLAHPLIVKDNYFHDIWEPAGVDWHADVVQTPMSGDGMQIVHNTLLAKPPATSSVNMQGTASDPATNVLVANNLMSGGAFTIYAGWGQNYRVENNRLTTRYYPKVGAYGIWYWDPNQDGDVIRSGNVIDETGRAANSNSF